nr:hypothetical protein [Bacillus sp. (in: firmicutes)]
MAKNKSIKITDEDYNRISSAAYDIQNYHIGEIIYTSNGQKLYVIDCKKTDKGLNAITLVTREDFRNSHEGKHPEKIQNAIIAYRGSEPISPGQFQDTIKQYRDEREQLIKEVEKKGINIPEDEDGSFYDSAKDFVNIQMRFCKIGSIWTLVIWWAKNHLMTGQRTKPFRRINMQKKYIKTLKMPTFKSPVTH